MDPPTQEERNRLLEKIYEACQITETGCLVPRGAGFDITQRGYIRTNFRGGKIMCHCATWCIEKGEELEKQDSDISHRCANPACCNPEHLCRESHVANLSRRNCPGYIYFRDDPTTGWCLCPHDPPCVIYTGVDRSSSIRLSNRK